MEIVKWGNSDKQKGYFPVKIRIVGTAVTYNAMQQPVGRAYFDEVAKFKFSMDDYGDWKALVLWPKLFGGEIWRD